MDSLTLICTAALLGGGLLYWFVCILGPAEQKGKRAVDLSSGSISAENVQANYDKYSSFFRRPKEIEKSEKVPDFVDTFYNLVTDIYEWGWGQSFHFSPAVAGKSHRDATRLHEQMAVDLIKVKPGDRIVDVGCGVGGPMRAIASHSRAKVAGITINEYQVNRARLHNKKAGLDDLCDVVCGNFLEMPFDNDSFDGAYSIEATCHAPKLEEVYAEVFRVLKPGALYVSYEWVTTEKFNGDDQEHVEVIQGIERGDALPGLRSYADIAATAEKVGFEVVEEKDLAVAGAAVVDPAEDGEDRLLAEPHCDHCTRLWESRPKERLMFTRCFSRPLIFSREVERGIFSPMHMILWRKPHPASHETSS
ncbi:24-methylenesterol C-methyltransferase 2 [Camellia lanceoleosa]|uniref:24-methylenesterol C-methyltransferase 2 n=1 Tax=Camellia lanceoleosa TaxID=1840588 RepID=A0ACC0GVI8_9ERIC|nr:24-methylenesterol C-methyltransferase 2 [Camellia lanceoleosa]